MTDRLKKIAAFVFAPARFPLVLLGAAVLAYGILFLWLGFYWDDFPMIFIAENYGLSGLARYFSTNRPVWGLLYQVSNALLGSSPWQWQIFAVFWRWVSAVCFWLFFRQLWPRQERAAAWAALAFLVYPGFGQQAIAMVYGHFFIVLSSYLFSLYAMLRAVRAESRRGLWVVVALAASLINLACMEYFFLLDLLRPLFLWVVFAEPVADFRSRIKRTALTYLPYLVVFLGVGIWRAFFFEYQTNNYAPVFFEQLKTQPLQALAALLGQVVSQTFTAGVAAWGQIFRLPDLAGLGKTNLVLYLAVLAAGLVLTAGYLVGQRAAPEGMYKDRLRWAGTAGGLGMLALLVAGWPFWLTELPVTLVFPNDRFTLPFLLGSVLLLTGLIQLIPGRAWVRALLVGLVITLSIGHHFENATSYRRDWLAQRTLFWQLTWRIPQLQPGTTLMSNDLSLRYYSDNSLTAPLNWIYFPDNQTQDLQAMFFFPAVRLGKNNLPELKPGLPIQVDYLAANFQGSTSQVVAVFYAPPACLRVLDPEVEGENWFVPGLLRDAAVQLSSTAWIIPDPAQPAQPMPAYYGTEPAHGWCYYYAKADLARQSGDWQKVVALGEEAFALGDYPNDPAERLPFIEGYAQMGNWQRALELSRESGQVTPAFHPVLCRLWERIDRTTPGSPEKELVVSTIQSEFSCNP